MRTKWLLGALIAATVLASTVLAAPEPDRGVGAEAMGQAGRGLYAAASGIMATRHANKPHRELTPREKTALRTVFGDLVDKVRITWAADPLDKWGPLHLGSTIAQTFGFSIYIAEPYTVLQRAQRDRRLPAALRGLHRFPSGFDGAGGVAAGRL